MSCHFAELPSAVERVVFRGDDLLHKLNLSTLSLELLPLDQCEGDVGVRRIGDKGASAT